MWPTHSWSLSKQFIYILHCWQVRGSLYCKLSLRLLQIRGQGHYRLSCVGQWAGQMANGGWSCVRASLNPVTQMAPHKTPTELKGQFNFTVWETRYPWNCRLQNYTLLLQEFVLNWGWRYGWSIGKWRWKYFGIKLWNYKGTKGPSSGVDIATGYGLDGSGIESRWGARF